MKNNKIRIIGGTLRSRLVSVFDETGLRPTPNRIRETLFNWLRDDIQGARCLDLFAGSGALGFEAISRGAKQVTFVEKNRSILENLKKNSQALHIDNAEFIEADALAWLNRSMLDSPPLEKGGRGDLKIFMYNQTSQNPPCPPFPKGGGFNIVFLDPPYAENLVPACLELLVSQHFLAPNAKIYLEHNQALTDLALPPSLTLQKHQKAGQVYYALLKNTL